MKKLNFYFSKKNREKDSSDTSDLATGTEEDAPMEVTSVIPQSNSPEVNLKTHGKSSFRLLYILLLLFYGRGQGSGDGVW